MERNNSASSHTLLHVLIALLIFGATFLLVMATAGVSCWFLPREYYSKATLEVHPDDYNFTASSQIKVFISKGILYPVIDSLKLVDVWSDRDGKSITKEQAYTTLIDRMALTPVRNTDLVQIGVYSTDRQEAANIANMIAAVYAEVRKDDQMQHGQVALAQLKDEVAKQRKIMEAAQEEMKKIRERDAIYDPKPETMELGDRTSEIVSSDEKQFNDAKSKCTELRTQLAQAEGLKPDELMTSLTTLNIPDPTVARILPLFQEASSEEARLLHSGLGEGHPRVRSVRAQKEVFSKQLTEALDAIRASLAIRSKVAEETLTALGTKLEASRSSSKPATPPNEDYLKIKQTYITAKKVLEGAESRLATQSVQIQMAPSPAKIWDKAEPSLYPDKPHVPRIMIAAAGGGALLAFLLTGIYLFWAFRRPKPALPR